MKLHKLHYNIVFGCLCKEVHDTTDEMSEIIKEKTIQLQVQICLVFFFFIQQIRECQVFFSEVVLLDFNASSTYFPPWTEKEL